jgi:predicted small metal-binding protein
MTLILTCPRCDARITANDEDELVAKVQSHVRDDHGATHALSRKHILARLHRRDPKEG